MILAAFDLLAVGFGGAVLIGYLCCNADRLRVGPAPVRRPASWYGERSE